MSLPQVSGLDTARSASQYSATPDIASNNTTAGQGVQLRNEFLQMMVAQIQNQDPTNPLDTNQMTNQLVQFASVEQQIAINQNLTSLISLQQSA